MRCKDPILRKKIDPLRTSVASVKLVKKINENDKRTSNLISSNSIRTEALARAGINLRGKHILEDRASTQGAMESQEDDINTTKSSKWLVVSIFAVVVAIFL